MDTSRIRTSLLYLRSNPILPILQLGLLGLLVGWFSTSTSADEHLFGWVLGAETLPSKHAEAYEFTDQFQARLSLENHYFYNKGVDGPRDTLSNTNAFRFGGAVLAGKYRLLSPFKDPIGLALRLEAGYLAHDEVDGLKQTEGYVAPQLILQKK